MIATIAAIQKAPEPIPKLRPPKGEITTNFPETVFFGSTLLFALLVLIAGRIGQVRATTVMTPTDSPIAAFRRRLAQIRQGSRDPLAESIHAVRRYVCDAYEIGSEGLTNEELLIELGDHPPASEETMAALREFLVRNDLLRFSPLNANTQNPVERASELVEGLEVRRMAATRPPPLPVAS